MTQCVPGWEVYIELGSREEPWCRPLLSTGDTDLKNPNGEPMLGPQPGVGTRGRSDQASVVTEGL